MWDLAEVFAGGPRDPVAAWEALGGEDAMSAQRAVWALAGGVDRAVAFLRERVTNGPPNDERIDGLVAGLASDDFAARDRACWRRHFLMTCPRPAAA